jgi:hypothetical protein
MGRGAGIGVTLAARVHLYQGETGSIGHVVNAEK